MIDPSAPRFSAAVARAGQAQLRALSSAIPAIIAQLGGHPPTGTWDYDANRLRLGHRPGAGISAIYRMPAGTGFNELGLTTEIVPATLPAATRALQSAGINTSSASSGLAGIDVQIPGDEQDPSGSVVRVSGWIHPHDPKLPALALATDRTRVLEMWGQAELLTGLRMMAYRPLRRAVIEATFTTLGPLKIVRKIFLKVGHPTAIAALARRHRLLEASDIPSPALIEPSHRGIIALEAGSGVSLSESIRQHAGTDLDPQDFISCLDALPETVMELPQRPAWSDSLRRYQGAATLTLPHREREIELLVSNIEVHLQRSVRGELVPTHGDFYDANILLRNGRITSLLDLDSLGPGYRVDDLGCLLGHLAILPSLGEKNRAATGTMERFGSVFETVVDPRSLWTRAAAVALTLIAGSRNLGADIWEDVAEERLKTVRKLLWRADACA
ncbi:phosphotransferase [Paeniglutamicibacter sp. Y32M11]|uniref:phosphotransferase n=1 Tax=Paeniglutamicibacter sp. Y32M11 TaxID=2853258 RepID=UPI001C53387C|nr:phosphotransferase [Paeniglutamicibacter sp. Y32M11]QXQ09211.1 aminoglycoside phosphotransferase family protein [Paeniglutamicibacter sp. Y32M11]